MSSKSSIKDLFASTASCILWIYSPLHIGLQGCKKIWLALSTTVKCPMSRERSPHVFQASICPPHTSPLFNRSPTPKEDQKYQGISFNFFLWTTSKTP